jgi:SAM-dependent methyltransferase
MDYPKVLELEQELVSKFPFLAKQVEQCLSLFGDEWAGEFETLLTNMFPEQADLSQATRGYCEFVLDGMRLMKRFEKERVYVNKSYAEVTQAVYHNPDYMLNLYLPGILLSSYLWPHHYRQLLFFKHNFLRDIQNSSEPVFYDVGIGTGFYSRYILQYASNAQGTGFDISDNSIQYTQRQISAYGYGERYRVHKQDIVTIPVEAQAPFLVSVEVLEHLEDPLTFLKSLRTMLKPGGKAFITAAITAPNADHIYLYNNSEEALAQLKAAGFKLEQYLTSAGYTPKHDEPVPTITAYIVV